MENKDMFVICQYCMDADGLVVQEARASTAMPLGLFSQNILASALEGLTH